jgi:hypothetical protein
MSSSRQTGFAYIWTLMLVAFMGVGLAIGSELYATSLRREKERELIFIGHQFRAAIGRYIQANPGGVQGIYPATLDELLNDSRFPTPQHHLRRLFRDPMTGKSEWGTVLQQGRIVGVHSLSEQVPIKQGNFERDDDGLRNKQRYADWDFTFPADLKGPPEGVPLKGLPTR